MTVFLSKTISVMSLAEADETTVCFNNLEPDAAAEDVDPGSLKSVILTREMWEDLGSPHTITMAIEPGDRLNEVGELVPGSLVIGNPESLVDSSGFRG